jgi:hypothetical protein
MLSNKQHLGKNPSYTLGFFFFSTFLFGQQCDCAGNFVIGEVDFSSS